MNQHVQRLLHIIHVPNQNINVAPRININLAENSSIKIVEEQLQLNDSIINHCIDINCAKDSSLDYYKINHPQNNSHLINNLNLNQDSNTDVKIFNLDLGADSASSLNHLKLNGEDSHVSCSTLFMPSAKRSSHHNVVIDHLSDKSFSSVNFRGVINDHATGSFFGKVRVAKERRKTSAFMQNKNLLLSDDSKISTVPILEIYNDDTECSHSATSGSLDKEKLFYLKTRGINEYDAKEFLIKSFIDELTSQIKSRRIKEYIDELILSNHET
jgi:Fe-S cluster assembly protein SufD